MKIIFLAVIAGIVLASGERHREKRRPFDRDPDVRELKRDSTAWGKTKLLIKIQCQFLI